jgi:two-component sensor histidine kinase
VDRCEIAITATWDGAFYVLTVTDNGVGLPADLDWAAGKTLGLRLVRLLARHQLHGQVEIDRNGGTTFRLRFPAPPVRRR